MGNNQRTGGFTATYFVYAFMVLENIGFVATLSSMVLYFLDVIKFDLSGSATTSTNYTGTALTFTLVGGFISDSYMTRLNTALIFGAIELMGYMLMIVQSHYKKFQPDPACTASTCIHGSKALLFYSSICLLALGVGGIRGSVPALGADQFDQRNPKERKNIASFFNWFLLSFTIGASIGGSFVVYVNTKVRWDIGFSISLGCAFLGLFFLALGKPFYRVRIPGNSPLIRVIEVLVVSVKNWRQELPRNCDELHEIRDPKATREVEAELIPHTAQFRFLDKAAICPKGVEAQRWKVCTVTQVEEVKILTRMMPILLSTILMNTCLAQLVTFTIQQGTMMNTNLRGFQVPPASMPVIPLLVMIVLIPVYEFAFVPLIRRITGHPSGITYLQRAGVGLVLSAISMTIAGFVEVKRKQEFIHHNHRISLFWIALQYGIFGIADMFTLAGTMEFFYREAPAGMRSLSTSFSWLSQAIGYFLSSIFVAIINVVSRNIGKAQQGWLEGRDMNTNHLERFYWFLAVLSIANFANYVCWAKWYEYKNNHNTNEET